MKFIEESIYFAIRGHL